MFVGNFFFFAPFAYKAACNRIFLSFFSDKFASNEKDETCGIAYIKLLIWNWRNKGMRFVIGKYCDIMLALLYALSIAFHIALTIVLSMEELITTLNIKGLTFISAYVFGFLYVSLLQSLPFLPSLLRRNFRDQ